MARHQRRPGETVAQERARLKRQDTVAGRATKRQNVGRKPKPKLNRGRLKRLRIGK